MEPRSFEHWRRIETLLDAVLDAAEGTPHATQDVPDDPAIRAEVDRLLRRRELARDFLEVPAAEFASALLEEGALPGQLANPSDDVTPERIGPYRILHEAGRGGMATVYLAERDDRQFEQRVAIKVLREAIASRSLVQRFIHERQILASLEHPSIARLLDGGITTAGLPWFAMEYVDGEPITRYCDGRRLGVTARLDLFLRVCDAVQYAHRNLIIHRDLKPSNILVQAPLAANAAGRVKLLDFGIARLLAPEPAGAAALTRAGVLPLTPEYASPEQLRGDPVSTASDVFQLGILLYELLAGRRPHDDGKLPRNESRRVVLEGEPEPPSSTVGPGRLRRRLHGDLDNIALMALRHSPERRYASVDRLADDVRRHLRGEPVHARGDSIRYRAGKFVKRHRVGVASTVTTFALVALLAIMMSVQAGRIARERDRAEQVTAFLVDLFEAFEPLEARGVTVTVPEVLRHGLERARTELADQPLLRATILDVIANVYELQGLHAEAEPLLEEVLAIRLAANAHDDLEIAHSRRRLADLRYERGTYTAEPLLRAALSTYRDRLGRDDSDVMRTEISLALLLRARGSYARADSMLRESLRHARTRDEMSLDVPIILSFLGKLRTRAGDYDEAERLLRESLSLRQSLLGREHPAVANSLDALGELMLARGDAAAAEVFFEDALAIRRMLYDEDHTDIASGRTYLARARYASGDFVTADSLLLLALPIFRRAFGDGSADVADVLEHLGATRRTLGDLESADTLFTHALAIWRAKPLETTHDRPATLLLRIGELRMAEGDLESAQATLAEGLELRQASLPAGHWKIAEAKTLLGASLSRLGQLAEAEPLLVEGVAGIRAVRGENNPEARLASRLLNEHLARR